MTTGKFITFEGGEGGGKSTQLALLAKVLEDAGIEVVTTREPGGTSGAEEIRNLLVRGTTDRWAPLAEVLLHFAARIDHVEKVIQPALESGAWVLCDRFTDSTMAYQGGGHGLGFDRIRELHHQILGNFRPDLTLILDLPVEEGLARAFGRAGAEDRYERMDLGFHERIRATFLAIGEEEPNRCAIIDATGGVDDVQRDICAEVSHRLGADLKATGRETEQ
ncbi:MAG TPA: dTMP kinase [Rhodospirillaceae bacterium]|nr:dTMP kinase [Rhodospirillaceae bacterium]